MWRPRSRKTLVYKWLSGSVSVDVSDHNPSPEFPLSSRRETLSTRGGGPVVSVGTNSLPGYKVLLNLTPRTFPLWEGILKGSNLEVPFFVGDRKHEGETWNRTGTTSSGTKITHLKIAVIQMNRAGWGMNTLNEGQM